MPRRNHTKPHQPFQFVNNCNAKRRFASKLQAETAANEQMLTNDGLKLAIYKCELCGGWHLTSANKK